MNIRNITSSDLPKVRSEINQLLNVKVYSESFDVLDGILFFIARNKYHKNLYLAANNENNPSFKAFFGQLIVQKQIDNELVIKKCPLSHQNALLIQKYFDFTRPRLMSFKDSFGFGDRLGLANAGHIRALKGSHFQPILAQQSIRELTRTRRTPEDVMDATVWAIFQEGYKGGFGADADHLKTTDDIDRMMSAGFTMFTIDPSEHVNNDADSLDEQSLKVEIQKLPWSSLKDKPNTLIDRYENKNFKMSEKFHLKPSRLEIFRALVKYGGALSHIKKLHDYLKKNYTKRLYEIECSVDETESVTTPFDHFFIANELKRLGVEFVSLAPRFIGDFEKGIDYKGDIRLFREEYQKHLQITKYFGNYKISLHSGSDKFSIYKVIGSFHMGNVHVKTAGTSYLEALKVVAIKLPQLFREIFNFSRDIYETEKQSYHVSAHLSKLKTGNEYLDQELAELFTNNDARQVLHVAFGRVLTEKDDQEKYLFRDRIYQCLQENEELHYRLLVDHFKKHLEPFK